MDTARQHFDSCDPAATLDNGLGVDNEEQGQPVSVCRGRTDTWDVVWPSFLHYD